jgi:hypothetical protein
MVVMASASKIAASKSTLSAAAPSRAGNHVASAAASEDAATPRLFHLAPWDREASRPALAVASVADSEVELMGAVAASDQAAEVAAASRTEDSAAGEEESDTKVVGLAAVTEAEPAMVAIAAEIVDTARHHRTHQLDRAAQGLPLAALHLVAALVDTGKARRIAVAQHLQVGMIAAGVLRMMIGERVDTEAASVDTAVEEVTIAVEVAATWSR